MRRLFLIALACAPLAAGAQGFGDASLRLAPQFASYALKQSGSETTISEIAVPIAFVLPLTSRLTFDIAGAFAKAQVKAGGGESTITGLTDTQLRLNYTLGTDAVVITAGINLPTGQYEVADSSIAAAGQIGNDFLAFPISSFGNGLAGTGGIALARSLGAWNIGLGASFRKSQEFGAFGEGSTATRFEPADEMRFRAGLDREAFGGRIMLGAVYSMFGDDACGGCEAGVSRSTYSTGDRIIGQAALETPLGGSQLYVGGWFLSHAAGQNIAGAAPPENIANVLASVGFNAGGLFLEPSVEGRIWMVDGEKQGNIAYGGLRTRFGLGSMTISPSVAYGVGTISGTTDTDVTGFKGGLVIRIGQ